MDSTGASPLANFNEDASKMSIFSESVPGTFLIFSYDTAHNAHLLWKIRAFLNDIENELRESKPVLVHAQS